MGKLFVYRVYKSSIWEGHVPGTNASQIRKAKRSQWKFIDYVNLCSQDNGVTIKETMCVCGTCEWPNRMRK